MAKAVAAKFCDGMQKYNPVPASEARLSIKGSLRVDRFSVIDIDRKEGRKEVEE